MIRIATGAFAALALAAASAAAQGGAERWEAEWPGTDFSKAAVDLSEIVSGGPPRDGIPAVDGPDFALASEAEGLDPREPVVTLDLNGHPPRAYPIRYLIWHEIANDEIAGVPVAVTYCPLCNTAVAFDRRLGDRILTFGVTGKLRHSDMIMFDRETESWWQQFGGEAIVGEMTGARLREIPSWMESWGRFREDHPGGLVMLEPDFARDYGRNPYVGYDRSARPFLYSGENPPHGIHPVARVVQVGARAWPLSRLAGTGEIVEAGVRLTWRPGQASALDSPRIAEGRDVGDVRVFDAATGEPLAHTVPFAFAFHAFHPEGEWMLGPEG
jgi:hypothetical protein